MRTTDPAVSRSTVAGPGGGDPMRAVLSATPEVDAEIVLVTDGSASACGLTRVRRRPAQAVAWA